MSDERLKAVVDDDGDEEEGELGIGLSLRSWFRVEGSSSVWWSASSGTPASEQEMKDYWCSQWERAVGGQQALDSDGVCVRWSGNLDQDSMAEEIANSSAGDQVLVTLDQAGLKRDMLHKRAKVDESDGFKHSNSCSNDLASSDADSSNDYSVAHALTTQSLNEKIHNITSLSHYVGKTIPREAIVQVDSESNPETGVVVDLDSRMDLTEDLLHLVFSFLGQKDLCKAGATCKQWQAASAHEDFWRILNFESTEISQTNFDAICERYPRVTHVNLFGVRNSDALVSGAMAHLRHLEVLILGKCQLGDNVFLSLMDWTTLRRLSIIDASLGSGMQEITISHERLWTLQIIKCRVLRVFVRCPQLKTLSLRRTSMAHAMLSCPQLHELDISSCHKLSDAGIRSAVILCPELEILDMSSCSPVSDETLREIAFSCPNLSILDASYCPNISLESVRLQMLTDLKLHNCEGITSASMSAISHSRMLKALQLDNCGLLTSVSLDMPQLQNISLVHCRKFVDLNLQCPLLTYIKVSNCSALRRVNIVSNALRKLVLPKQESLSILSLQCYHLKDVDLSDCESLTNSIFEVFSDGGGCPLLKLLVLDNCESLSMVTLRSSSLVRLSLIGCRALSALDLSCPNLQKVNLDGCDHLEMASFSPVGLGSLNLGICPKLNILRIEAPKLSVLELKGCGVLSRAFINCPFLTSLDASFCRQLLDESLSIMAATCSSIESLTLSSCLTISLDGLLSLHYLRNLILLDLSYTFLMDLQPVFESCSHLEILRLSACKCLTDSSLDALYKEGALPALRELDLSYSSIGQSAITALLVCCTNIVSLNLNGCANMHDLVWGLSNNNHSLDILTDMASSGSGMLVEYEKFCQSERLLETINCTGCPNIKKILITSTARCSHLSKLNLNLSFNLKEVYLACSQLSSLNLSNCSSLEILRLDCPKLTNLQLLACTMLPEDVLEAAVTHCGMLEVLNVHSCAQIDASFLRRLRLVCPSLKRIQSGM